jgi:hypothetical protein
VIGITVAQTTAARASTSGAESVIAHARCRFLAGQRLEMGELAAVAGVNRATLFRWVGGRDRLLGEVVWSITEPTLNRAASESDGSGAQLVADVMTRFADMANRSPAFHGFILREPQRALRVMTTRAGGVQERIVCWVQGLVTGEVESGRMSTTMPIHDLAFLLVRITEAFVYSDVITGEAPDASKVGLAVAALLGCPVPPRGTAIHDELELHQQVEMRIER